MLVWQVRLVYHPHFLRSLISSFLPWKRLSRILLVITPLPQNRPPPSLPPQLQLSVFSQRLTEPTLRNVASGLSIVSMAIPALEGEPESRSRREPIPAHDRTMQAILTCRRRSSRWGDVAEGDDDDREDAGSFSIATAMYDYGRMSRKCGYARAISCPRFRLEGG
jgi:hypothetical protein